MLGCEGSVFVFISLYLSVLVQERICRGECLAGPRRNLSENSQNKVGNIRIMFYVECTVVQYHVAL